MKTEFQDQKDSKEQDLSGGIFWEVAAFFYRIQRDYYLPLIKMKQEGGK